MLKGLLSFLGAQKPQTTASLAKERLQIIIAREHADGAKQSPDFLPKLKEELIAVLAKYIKVDAESIKVSLDRKGNLEVLDVNVVIGDELKATTPAMASTPAPAAAA